MKNGAYWEKRFKQIEESQHQQGLRYYADIEKQYLAAQRQMEAKINAWYQRFSKNNEISLVEARRLLNSSELDELKWDVEQYIRYGKENAINGQWIKELENASAKVHINRLEALKLQMQQSLEVMFGNQLDSVDSAIRDVYQSGFLHTAYEIQKGIGTGWSFASPNNRLIDKVIRKPWAADGKTFSDRIWANKQKLVNELNTSMTQNIITGANPQKTIDELARKMNVSKQNAGRLVMTEQAAFSNAAQRDCFEELDVEQFEVVETLDGHTCGLCGAMDGKVFPMSEFEIGVTAPPFHPNCRGCTCPYFEDDFGVPGKRAARGADGKTYYVPADMTYKVWKKSFVDDGVGVSDKKFTTKRKSTDGSVEIPDIKFATKKNSIITAKQKFEDTMTVSKAYDELPIRVKQTLSDITFEFGWDGSACDIVNRTIRVGIGTSKAEIFHEVGHLIENYMMDQNVVAKYKEYLVDGLSYSDIMIKTYYNSIGEPINIYILTGNRFESEYQARLYVNKMSDALNIDGTINTDLLGESISEAFRKYMNNESVSDEVRKIIEGVVL